MEKPNTFSHCLDTVYLLVCTLRFRLISALAISRYSIGTSYENGSPFSTFTDIFMSSYSKYMITRWPYGFNTGILFLLRTIERCASLVSQLFPRYRLLCSVFLFDKALGSILLLRRCKFDLLFFMRWVKFQPNSQIIFYIIFLISVQNRSNDDSHYFTD